MSIKIDSPKSESEDAPKDAPKDAPRAVPKKVAASAFKGRRPCDWNIVAIDDETISATNHVTRESFEGTREEFNARMRG